MAMTTKESPISTVQIDGDFANKKFKSRRNYESEKDAYRKLHEWTILHTIKVLRTNDEEMIITFPTSGEDLYDLVIAQNLILSLADKHHIAMCVAEALHGLHERRHLYLDLKLENVLYDKKTRKVTLIDFSQILDMRGTRPEIKGGITVSYLPPEFYTNNIDLSLDVWSLGIFMAELYGIKIQFRSGKKFNGLRDLNEFYFKNRQLKKISARQVYSHFMQMVPVVAGDGEVRTLIRTMIQPNANLRPIIKSVLCDIKELVSNSR